MTMVPGLYCSGNDNPSAALSARLNITGGLYVTVGPVQVQFELCTS